MWAPLSSTHRQARNGLIARLPESSGDAISTTQREAKPIQVLLVGRAHHGADRPRGVCIVEGLFPGQVRAAAHRVKAHSEREERLAIMPDDDATGRLQRGEEARVFIGVAVGPVHGEDPSAVDVEIKCMKGIGESLGAPPGGQHGAISEGGITASREKGSVLAVLRILFSCITWGVGKRG